ncbi:MAG: superoxide dismutase family protein [Terrisporobacter sp.]|uniref:superoxide dismutase family protein n=1 Tax=Terrisporobacter sp. TaxID=1965305 RepID=UPI002FCC8133
MEFLCINNEMPSIFDGYKADHPTAVARLRGGPNSPDLRGDVLFYQLDNGVYIKAYVVGIPSTNSKGEKTRFHGFHIHQNGNCNPGTSDKPFPSVGNHFNPTDEDHPFHTGDLPPILSNDGIGILSVYTTAFTILNILEKSVILHENADDFITQPSGNSGAKIACGRIMPYHY